MAKIAHKRRALLAKEEIPIMAILELGARQWKMMVFRERQSPFLELPVANFICIPYFYKILFSFQPNKVIRNKAFLLQKNSV